MCGVARTDREGRAVYGVREKMGRWETRSGVGRDM